MNYQLIFRSTIWYDVTGVITLLRPSTVVVIDIHVSQEEFIIYFINLALKAKTLQNYNYK